jgi:hypothetical protein
MSSQLTVQPDASAGLDSYITSANTDVNFGNTDVMPIGTSHVGKSTTYSRGILRFDLSAIPPSATVTSATFTLVQGTGTTISGFTDFFAQRVTQPGWTEFGVTWNTYDGSHSWSSPGGDSSSTGRATATINSGLPDLVFSVAALVIDAIANRGGVLHLLVIGPESGSTNNFVVVNSSDAATASARPKLVVNYDVPLWGVPNFSGGMQELSGNLGA